MPIVTRDFSVNDDVLAIANGLAGAKTYTWNPESQSELALILNAASELENSGWVVGIQCPVSGIQRSSRIPVFAIKDKVAVILKPTNDSKKVNISGLKMLEFRSEVQNLLTDFQVSAVVMLSETFFDERRRSSADYMVWLRG